MQVFLILKLGKMMKKIQLKEHSKSAQKNIHMVIKGDNITRLEKLQAKVFPHTKTEVFINALQLFEALVDEYEKESDFYIKRKGYEKIEKIDFFE